MKPAAGLFLRRALPIVIACTPSLAWAAPGDVAGSFDSPCKYPAGLACDGQHLFVADWREATIFQINPADGQVIRSWDAPTLKPHGLACGQGKLFVSDDHTGHVYVLNLDSGIVENTFEAPASSATGSRLPRGGMGQL